MSHAPFELQAIWKSVSGSGRKGMSALGMSHTPFESQAIENHFLALVTKQ